MHKELRANIIVELNSELHKKKVTSVYKCGEKF
jgi:hypothetical protein